MVELVRGDYEPDLAEGCELVFERVRRAHRRVHQKETRSQPDDRHAGADVHAEKDLRRNRSPDILSQRDEGSGHGIEYIEPAAL